MRRVCVSAVHNDAWCICFGLSRLVSSVGASWSEFFHQAVVAAFKSQAVAAEVIVIAYMYMYMYYSISN